MTYDPTNNPLASFFFGNNANVNMKLREKIALAQMMQKRKAPSTFGEGLSAIGDSLGEIGMMRRLEAQDQIAQQEAMQSGAIPGAGSGLPPPTPQGPSPVAAATQSAPGPLYQPSQDPTSQEPVPPTVQEGGPPRTLPQFRQASRTMAAPPAPAVPPQTMQQEPVPTDAPIRTNPNGTLAGNITAPQVLPPPTGQPGRPTVADFGQKLALAPTPPPVMAQGEVPSFDAPLGQYDQQSDPRREATMALLRQKMGGQGAPTPPAPPAPPAPPMPPTPQADASQGIRPAPPQAALPPAKPAYVPPDPGMPQGAPIIGPSPEEMLLTAKVNKLSMGNPYAAQSPDAINLQKMQKDRELRQTEANELFKSRITQANEQAKLRQQGLMDRDKRTLDNQKTSIEVGDLPSKLREEGLKRQQEIQDAQEKATLQARFGGRAPEQMFTEFDKEKTAAAQTSNALSQYAQARDLLDKGVIVGTGQGWKVNAAKVAGAFGIDDPRAAVARTEQLQAALKSTLGIAIANIQGSGQKVSDADIAVASGTIGADPSLQIETIKSLTQRAEKVAREKINDYEDQRDYYFGGTRAERRYDLPTPPTAPEPYVNKLLEHKASKEVREEFDQRFGQGAADLEIARAKRRERRGG